MSMKTYDTQDKRCIEQLRTVHSHESWKWYGYAGHLIVSRRCAFHLTTRVGKYLVSTVGAYYQSLDDKMTTIGSGKDEYYETMVFNCDGEDGGNPVVNDYCELYGRRYSTSVRAELGHYELCWEYHNKC